jgi:uncharacterized membrane protein
MSILPIHIAGGILALVFGYVALFAVKGGTVHRRSGLLVRLSAPDRLALEKP